MCQGNWRGSIQYDAKLYDNKGRVTSYHTSLLKNINIVAEELDDEDTISVEYFKNLGYDNYTAEWMSKMRNQFYGNATYTSISQFYNGIGIASTTWKLKNGTENTGIIRT